MNTHPTSDHGMDLHFLEIKRLSFWRTSLDGWVDGKQKRKLFFGPSPSRLWSTALLIYWPKYCPANTINGFTRTFVQTEN
jgi:hypothetical protein